MSVGIVGIDVLTKKKNVYQKVTLMFIREFEIKILSYWINNPYEINYFSLIGFSYSKT